MLKNILEASYQKPEVAQKTLESSGFKYDPELSSMKAKVFTDKEGKPHIAYRGTELNRTWKTALDDIKTDAMIGLGLGKKTKQYKDTVALRKKVEEKYGQPSTAIGHSKAGWQAEMSGAKDVITFNKATGLGDIGKTIKKGQTDIRTKGDLVSLLSLTQKRKGNLKQQKFTSNPLKAHGLKGLRF
jgi:hypothetical protein